MNRFGENTLRVLVSLLLLAGPALGQGKRLWVLRSPGEMVEYDPATFAVKQTVKVLDHAAELFRTVEHVVRLALGRAHKWLPATEHAQQVTERLSAQILRREFPRGLEDKLFQTSKAVRTIYDRVMACSEAAKREPLLITAYHPEDDPGD